MIINERVYSAKNREIKYLLKEHKNSKYMIVLFSGLSSHPEKNQYIIILNALKILKLQDYIY